MLPPVTTRFRFDEIYRDHPDYYGLTPADSLQKFIESHAIHQGQALDLGSGQGRDAIYLAQRGLAVTAVDICATSMTDLAARSHDWPQPIDCLTRDITTYRFPEVTFDFVNATTLLDHLDVEDIQPVVDGMIRTLVSGGFGHVMVFNKQDPGYHVRIEHDLSYQSITSETAEAVAHYFDNAAELRALFMPQGDPTSASLVNILDCEDTWFEDRNHGNPHIHHVAIITFQKN